MLAVVLMAWRGTKGLFNAKRERRVARGPCGPSNQQRGRYDARYAGYGCCCGQSSCEPRPVAWRAQAGPGSRANAHRAITAASGKVEHLVHQSPTTQTRIIILPPLVRGEVSARRPSRWSPRDGDSAFEGQMAHAAEGATQVEVRTQQPGTCRAAATRSDRARPGGPSHGLHLRPRPGVLDGLQPAAATRRFPLSPRLLRRVRCERPLRPGLRMRRACTLA